MNVKLLGLFAVSVCIQSQLLAELIIGGVTITTSHEHYLEYRRHLSVPFSGGGGKLPLYHGSAYLGDVWNKGTKPYPAGETVEEIALEIYREVDLKKGNPVQREIVEKMIYLSERFEFNDLDHAKDHVYHRLATIGGSNLINIGDKFRWANPAKGKPHKTTAQGWKSHEDVDGRRRAYIRSGTPSYNAIQNLLLDGTTWGECQGAKSEVVWWGASQALGEDRFNALYPNGLDMDIRNEQNRTPYINLKKVETESPIALKPKILDGIIPGDYVAFVNYNYGKLVDRNAPGNFALYKKSILQSVKQIRSNFPIKLRMRSTMVRSQLLL